VQVLGFQLTTPPQLSLAVWYWLIQFSWKLAVKGVLFLLLSIVSILSVTLIVWKDRQRGWTYRCTGAPSAGFGKKVHLHYSIYVPTHLHRHGEVTWHVVHVILDWHNNGDSHRMIVTWPVVSADVDQRTVHEDWRRSKNAEYRKVCSSDLMFSTARHSASLTPYMMSCSRCWTALPSGGSLSTCVATSTMTLPGAYVSK